MKKQMNSIPRAKLVSIVFLYAFSAAITAAGIIFGTIALVNGVSLPVLTSQIPGVVFGAVVAFLGVRYFLSVNKLKAQVFKDSSQFSWNNFKRQKKRGAK